VQPLQRRPASESSYNQVKVRSTATDGFIDPGNLQRRWAPYVRTHESGQGQLPLDQLRPQGLRILSRGADRSRYIGHAGPNSNQQIAARSIKPLIRERQRDRRHFEMLAGLAMRPKTVPDKVQALIGLDRRHRLRRSASFLRRARRVCLRSARSCRSLPKAPRPDRGRSCRPGSARCPWSS
jgi:hypothetical protein